MATGSLSAGKSEIVAYVVVHSFSFAGDATSSIVTTGDHANREPTRVFGSCCTVRTSHVAKATVLVVTAAWADVTGKAPSSARPTAATTALRLIIGVLIRAPPVQAQPVPRRVVRTTCDRPHAGRPRASTALEVQGLPRDFPARTA